MPTAIRVPQHSMVDRFSRSDGKRNGYPQDYGRSTVRHLSAAPPCACSNGDKHLRCSPSVEQYLPQESDPQLASISLIQHRLFHRGFSGRYAVAAAEVPFAAGLIAAGQWPERPESASPQARKTDQLDLLSHVHCRERLPLDLPRGQQPRARPRQIGVVAAGMRHQFPGSRRNAAQN